MRATQVEVHQILKKYGPLPDQALVPMAQHVGQVHQSSSGLRSRRSELAAAGYVHQVGSQKMPSGRMAAVWAVTKKAV